MAQVAQSLSRVIVHLVFSTKNRHPFLASSVRAELHPYIGGILRGQGCVPLQTGGVEDHVHTLFVLPRTKTVAQIAEEVKRSTSVWIKPKLDNLRTFGWQSGYGAFSISHRDIDAAVHYIQTQEIHHQRVSFQDEYRALMKEVGIEIDERYAWE